MRALQRPPAHSLAQRRAQAQVSPPGRRCMLSALALGTLYATSPAALCQALLGQPGPTAQKTTGRPVNWPEVKLLDGTRWGLAQAQGKMVIVVFWSTTCPFCLRHNAHIEKLRVAAAGRPLEILTVARDKDPAAVKAYLARHGYGFQVTMEQGPMGTALSTRKVIPLTLLVDRQGRLGQEIPGEMFEEDVMDWLRLV
ncbi:MAG: TlpA disulfide reductase family protein [Betaproteobacteria bacterium]